MQDLVQPDISEAGRVVPPDSLVCRGVSVPWDKHVWEGSVLRDLLHLYYQVLICPLVAQRSARESMHLVPGVELLAGRALFAKATPA